ncbi:hypothetical protein H8E77_05505 [bacterium]|nr:hypothetical protein [bacterium]
MRYGEIQIVLNPVGVDRTELVAIPGDQESEEAAVQIYQRMALEIHRFSKRAKQLLRWDNEGFEKQ